MQYHMFAKLLRLSRFSERSWFFCLFVFYFSCNAKPTLLSLSAAFSKAMARTPLCGQPKLCMCLYFFYFFFYTAFLLFPGISWSLLGRGSDWPALRCPRTSTTLKVFCDMLPHWLLPSLARARPFFTIQASLLGKEGAERKKCSPVSPLDQLLPHSCSCSAHTVLETPLARSGKTSGNTDCLRRIPVQRVLWDEWSLRRRYWVRVSLCKGVGSTIKRMTFGRRG